MPPECSDFEQPLLEKKVRYSTNNNKTKRIHEELNYTHTHMHQWLMLQQRAVGDAGHPPAAARG